MPIYTTFQFRQCQKGNSSICLPILDGKYVDSSQKVAIKGKQLKVDIRYRIEGS